VRTAHEEAGTGTPVVCLHGLTATRRHVLMGSRALERSGHRVVLYDARGHGASQPAQTYAYADLARDLHDLLDALEIDRAVLVGVSMGAHTAIRFALDQAHRVSGLVLITPAHLPGRRPDLEEWDALARGLREGGVDGFLAAYDLARVAPRWRETLATALRQRMAAHEHPDAVADALEAVPRSRPFDQLADLAGLPPVPTLVIGSRDDADPGHPLEAARAYAEGIPGARLELEEPGAAPLAWQGGRVSRLVGGLTRPSAAA
jgi:pimeloyl-ACP methyl ester carboxylesterase